MMRIAESQTKREIISAIAAVHIVPAFNIKPWPVRRFKSLRFGNKTIANPERNFPKNRPTTRGRCLTQSLLLPLVQEGQVLRQLPHKF
jgi:hypothetical protein